jgi:hypothetical protein
MKKKLLVAVAILGLAMGIATAASAQSLQSLSFLTSLKTLKQVSSNSETATTINARALRDFKRNYPDVNGEKWYAILDGYMATFSKANIQELAFYSKSGYWQYTIMYYGEKGLPDEVKERVKKAYYNYSINGVEEIRTVEQTYFMVHVQDESTEKKLMVTDGEMRVIEDFTKS